MTQPELDDLVERFTRQEISRAEWTHLAHLRVGAWHASRFGADQGLDRLRVGIRLLNERNGVANTSRSGYHETITRAYVMLLVQYLAGFSDDLPLHRRVAAIESHRVAEKEFLLGYYSRPRLMSAQAREWIEPDVRPLLLD